MEERGDKPAPIESFRLEEELGEEEQSEGWRETETNWNLGHNNDSLLVGTESWSDCNGGRVVKTELSGEYRGRPEMTAIGFGNSGRREKDFNQQGTQCKLRMPGGGDRKDSRGP